MSDPARIIECVEHAEDAFEYVGQGEPDFEDSINQGEDWKKQLTKACRYLESVRVLRAEDGFNGAVVELCFGAVERTLEAYMIWNTDDTIEDYQDHEAVYNRAAEQGLFTRETAANLKEIYHDNRTDHYYGAFVPTQQKEDAMYDLAECIHHFVKDQIQEGSICVCE